jgi:hypothetical protein
MKDKIIYCVYDERTNLGSEFLKKDKISYCVYDKRKE